jgi:hypothetical protein
MDVGNSTFYIPRFVPYVYDQSAANGTAIANDIILNNYSVVFMSLATGGNLSTTLGDAGICESVLVLVLEMEIFFFL